MNKNDAPPDLRQTSVALMAFLTCITLGIYFPIWYLSRTNEFNRLHSQEKLGKGLCIFGIIFFSIGILMSLYSGFSEVLYQMQNGGDLPSTFNYLNLAANIIMFIVLISFVQQTFKIKRILIDHYNGYLKKNVKFSNAFTFLFLNFYLQQKINELNQTAP